MLKPVTEALGGMAANVLHPIIYGADGQGGLAGVFKGGKQDPVRVSTDQNTAATMQNSAVMAALTAILAAGMGVAAPSLQSGAAGAAGVLGISIPSISAPAKMSTPAPVVEFQQRRIQPDGNAVQQCHGWRLRSGWRGSAPWGRITLGRARSPAVTRPPLGLLAGGLVQRIGEYADVESGAGRDGRIQSAVGVVRRRARGGATGGSGPSGLAGIARNFKSTNWGSFERTV